jgi:hypothetical protein
MDANIDVYLIVMQEQTSTMNKTRMIELGWHKFKLQNKQQKPKDG